MLVAELQGFSLVTLAGLAFPLCVWLAELPYSFPIILVPSQGEKQPSVMKPRLFQCCENSDAQEHL